MKHLTVADKAMLIGDEAGDLLIRYSAALGRNNLADDVDVHVYSSDGDEVEASLVLNQGMTIMAESTHTSLPEPDNAEAVAYMRSKLEAMEHPPEVQASKTEDEAAWETEIDLS
jgi:hypothetical protein